jgi:hypothetical protein
MRRMIRSQDTIVATLLLHCSTIRAFVPLKEPSGLTKAATITATPTRLFSDWKDNSQDSNQWSSTEENQDDWQDVLERKNSGSFWSEFTPSDSTEISSKGLTDNTSAVEVDESEAWLDTLASLQAEEVEFNMKEADRADKVRRMLDWGFDTATIESTLAVSMDSTREDTDEVEGMKLYRQQSYVDDEDLATIESHKAVPIDSDTGEPIRTQMVYVDEHTCIGCTK